MSTTLFALDRSAFRQVRCQVCWRGGPAAALDGSIELLDVAAREHFARRHPGADEDMYVVETCRAVVGWDGSEPPHDCRMAAPHRRPLSREEARQALTAGGMRACEICRPDSELGILE
ncbi:DUF6233 domain-containing protein [Streptomyces sp. SR27]|uniref:DUF6233 domain-containing protein n=1 Tax=Streptomyces sp. SR27 TaxID=3076630 RepID=UPI00295BABDE|nr:DUF6233 domain-containing protein [Streptomyces sp. SR27]MDV9192294.1 DUF6233 domain-containing protein [Streptomyces sp. SR27]